jgi:hypothetical protein
MLATSSTASRNAASFALDGLVKPVIFLTNCSDAARTSSSVTGGSKLKSVLMFLHIAKISRAIGSDIGAKNPSNNCPTKRTVAPRERGQRHLGASGSPAAATQIRGEDEEAGDARRGHGSAVPCPYNGGGYPAL